MNLGRSAPNRLLAMSVGLCILSAFTNQVQAAGFNCKYAKSHVEKLICTDSHLSKLDDEMNVLFDKIEGETAGHDGETGQVIDPAGKEQKHWRETVRDAWDAQCLKSAYTDRLAEMRKNWAEALDSDK
ncbi:hypothetical protein [Rhizobium sp. P44RR-XXIV]|uniref:lysozyme inhibitor LprI family protein n=1 Tax=Rhizobium sp. P44RR-XXIV TaxID=1921145 RepID=UPI0010AA4AF0|nr:hypothetical protein [Rhizobium sp. P44RR-XXIV]TIX90782.1 hypothetical protein BSK43_016165 [Rhizobium sp. P44RR-XXIV]